MRAMRRFSRRMAPLLLAAASTAVALPASASASQVEVGATSTPLATPKCPTSNLQNCLIVSFKTTALQSISDGKAYPATVNSAGQLTSFKVGVSAITSNKTNLQKVMANLQKSYGGPPEAAITVLRQLGKTGGYRWVVAAESQPVNLTNYLGQVAQFPLSSPIPVVPGEQVALTVPTWAPILSYGLGSSKFAYRQSRTATSKLACNKNAPNTTQLARLAIGSQAVYGCSFPGTRVQYTATEQTSTAAAAARTRTSLHPRVLKGHRVG